MRLISDNGDIILHSRFCGHDLCFQYMLFFCHHLNKLINSIKRSNVDIVEIYLKIKLGEVASCFTESLICNLINQTEVMHVFAILIATISFILFWGSKAD